MIRATWLRGTLTVGTALAMATTIMLFILRPVAGADCSALKPGSVSRQECESLAKKMQKAKEDAAARDTWSGLGSSNPLTEYCGPDPGPAPSPAKTKWLGCLDAFREAATQREQTAKDAESAAKKDKEIRESKAMEAATPSSVSSIPTGPAPCRSTDYGCNNRDSSRPPIPIAPTPLAR